MSTLAKYWLLLCCVAASRQLSIVEFAVPNSVQSGQNVELKCSYELKGDSETILYVKWWRISLGSPDNWTQLYQRIENNPGATGQQNVEIKDHDTIILVNVTAADSGLYECVISEIDTEAKKQQEMIVFTPGTGPELNVTTIVDGPDEDEEDDVLIECEASGVSPLPEFVITVDGLELNITEDIVGPDAKGLYDIYGNTTVSLATADGADIHCELVFINPNVTHQPYVANKIFNPSGAGSTTEMPEDANNNTTPESLQDSGSHGNKIKASGMTMLFVAVLVCLNSLL